MKQIPKKIFLFISVLFISSLLLFMSCNNEGISESEYQIEYTRTAQLKNTYENEIIVLAATFIQKTSLLKTSIVNFKNNTTLTNLSTTKENWLEVLKTWKQLELYNLSAVENSFIHFEINRWETNTDNVNNFINGNEVIDEGFIASKGSSSKGISALEYLLFSSDENQNVLNSFTIDANYDRRLDYILALSENLYLKSNELFSLWENDKVSFISSIENGISGSQNQLTNAMINLIEEVIISKLGNPLGDNSGGVLKIDALEAARSKSSLLIIKEHLTALKRCYTGAFIDNDIQWGFDNYLKLISREDLDINILDAFNECQIKIDNITNALSVELLENTKSITDLQESFRDLLILVKVDLSNAIGATVTLNDNDGD